MNFSLKNSRWFGKALASLAVILAIAAPTGAYLVGEYKGRVEGLNLYHEACYQGAIMFNNEDGTAVQCAPLTQVPKEELNKYNKDRS
jgi:hypothetical protein